MAGYAYRYCPSRQKVSESARYNRYMPYFVYLLLCRDGSIYTGITTDLARRLTMHKTGKGGHYTRAHGAQKLIHSELFENRSKALKREAEIKSCPREKKLSLTQRKQKRP